jgi:CYTH domain-containing protein/predicted ATPase
MKEITKIALTGAPCSGKSTALDYLYKYYTSKGYKVIVMPESARIVINNGTSRDDMFLFESEVINHQLNVESEIDNQISKLNDDKILVLYDRGIPDALSYLTLEQSKLMQQNIGFNLIHLWSRYDAVMFFETVDSDNYVTDDARQEDRTLALKSQDKLLDVWVGHPHLRYIKNTNVFEDKIDNVIGEIDCLLNNVECEKKYLIEYPNIDELSKYKIFKVNIEQVYLTSDIGSHRIRKRGINDSYVYFETLKIRISGDKCYEYESVISKEKYDELKLQADPKKSPIIKDRYCLLYNAQYFELDLFAFWNDRALVELEVRNDSIKPDLPKEIKVIKDVSKSKKYKNNYLASVIYNENS